MGPNLVRRKTAPELKPFFTTKLCRTSISQKLISITTNRMEKFETPPAKNSTTLSESQVVSPCQTPATNDSSTLVEKSNDMLRSENERLKFEIQQLKFDLNSDVQHDKIKVLTNTIELNESTIENYKEQVELYEQMILYEKSNTSRKGRLQKVNVTSKLDMKTTRDVMTLHVTPICKFVSKQQL